MQSQPYRVPVSMADRARAGLALHLAAALTGIAPEAVAAGKRRSPACRARWLALYLAHVGHGWPLERVGHAFGVNRATAAAACRWVEEGRESPRLDRALDRLECLMQAALDGPVLDLAR